MSFLSLTVARQCFTRNDANLKKDPLHISTRLRPGTRSIAIGYNTCHYVILFRSNLIRAIQTAGFTVSVLAPRDAYTCKLQALGVNHIDVPMDVGTNPFSDVLLVSRIWRHLRRERPAAYLGFTVKPNVYGSLSAHLLRIPVINNIAGLGSVFIKKSWLTYLVRYLYRIALSRSAKVFFQNNDDCQMFVNEGLVPRDIADQLPGSGVDLEHFSFNPLASGAQCKTIKFLLISRMLWDKGVGEYVAASRIIRDKHTDVEMYLMGPLDVQNPTAISRTQIDEWVAEGVIKYLGVTDDVRPFISQADCVVLPSYREGTPRSLLEAAAMGRPIITTNAVGCREVVENGSNGFLCRPRDAVDLADQISRMIALSPHERVAMGRRGRAKVEKEFDELVVIQKYLKTIDQLVQR